MSDPNSTRWNYANIMARPALRRANVGEKSRLHLDCRLHAGAWHRRQHSDLQFGEPHSIRAVAVSPRWTGHDDLGLRPRRLAHRRNVRYLSRVGGAKSFLRRGHGDEPLAADNDRTG